MSRIEDLAPVVKTEHLALRILCQTQRPQLREEGMRLLACYVWQGRDHEVVFEVLGEPGWRDPDGLRAQFPARLTRKGFPDLDFESYFEPHGLAPQQALKLIRALAPGRQP
jgi:hypothetical protein